MKFAFFILEERSKANGAGASTKVIPWVRWIVIDYYGVKDISKPQIETADFDLNCCNKAGVSKIIL
jgi:hypothetical protein